MSDDKKPQAVGPAAERKPKIRKRKRVAGGLPAVSSALKHSLKQMGVSRTWQTLSQVNQKAGFDCPGCAWPDPDDRRSMVEFCENGAKAVADEATRRRIGPTFFQQWRLTQLSEQTDYWLGQQGRLTQPHYLRPGGTHYEAVSWKQALDRIAEELNRGNADEAVFYTSGRTSNEAAFLYQLFVRVFGTNNLPDCSNMCHESSGYALGAVLGSGKGTVTLKDFDHADCIAVIGQNPGTNHPRMLTALQAAARRGAVILSVNPLLESGLERFRHPQEVSGILGRATKLATHHLPVRINGDVALIKGWIKALLEEESLRPGTVLDHDFILRHTQGFTEFSDDIARESWAAITEASGLSEQSIRDTAAVIGRAKRLICCWAMGLTQHQNAVSNIQSVVNLLLLGGHFGRPGAGACPVRGHSNVQGDRTMGIWERPTAEFLNALEKEFNFSVPRAHGYDTVAAIQAMVAGQVGVFFALGGNFLSAAPDTERTAQGLRRCRLTVHVSTKLNRSHLVTGREAIILPCLGRSEIDRQATGPQFVTVEDSMGVVHASVGRLPPASEYLQSEPWIIANLARATLGARHGIDWEGLVADYDRVRYHISRVVPGFEAFTQRVRVPGGFTLPHPVRDRREFPTISGKAIFTVHPLPAHRLEPGRYLMATIRSHDQYNTTVYGLDDRYRGIYQGRRVVLMNDDDIASAGMRAGEMVDLISHFNGETRRAHRFTIVSYAIPRGCVATYFPETNVLVPIDSFADGSRTPTSKSVVVSLERYNGT
jgi:molybdopterin-dependent oxidoreductase alpha subunit